MNTATAPIPQHADLAIAPRGAALPNWLRFWLPLLLMGTAVFVSRFDTRFAMEAAGADLEVIDEAREAGGTNRMKQVAFLAFGGLGALLFWLRPATGAWRPLAALILATATVLVGSILWSDLPATSARRVVLVLTALVGTAGVASQWRAVDLCRAAFLISATFLALSIFFELRAGTFLASSDYRFSGIFHMNRQALNCAILCLASWHLFRATERSAYLVCCAAAVVFLVLTASRGGLVSLAAAFSASAWLGASVKQRFIATYGALALLAAGLLYIGLAPRLPLDVREVFLMGRHDEGAQDSALTGRIPIWMALSEKLAARPLLGYGYGAFWSPERIHEMSYIHDWAFTNAHSVYLETALNVGLVGLALALSAVAAAFYRGWRVWKATAEPCMGFLLALLVLGAVNGLVEAIFVSISYAFLVGMVGLWIIAFDRGRGAPLVRG